MSLMWEINFPTQSQLLVALKMADYANDQGDSIYPSRSRLAVLTQCSESTAKNVLRAFRSVGLLHVLKEGGSGPRSTTHYGLNIKLILALHKGDCQLVGSSDEVTLEWLNKGAEFDPLERSEFDPLDNKRGQPGELRGQPGPAKGSAGYPQSTNNHQIDSSTRAGACAMDGAAPRAEVKGEPTLVLSSDPQWRVWINWLRNAGQDRAAHTFEVEGAMVVYAPHPSPNCERPKLPPVKGSAKWNEMQAQRKAVNVTARMTGEHVE